MKVIRLFSFTVVALIALAAMVSSCGGGGSSGSISSFSQLPDASAMVSTSTSSTSYSRAAVTGTAPLITALKDDPDQYFWNGLVAEINASGLIADDRARQFWGNEVGGPSGQGGCMMAQNTAQVFGRLLESGSSTCYMKNMPTAASGVTITPTPDGGVEHVFDQQTADTLARVDISNMPAEEGDEGHSGPEKVFIKVYGSDSVTSDVYKVQLYFCNESGVNGYELFEVNKSTLAYSGSSVHQDDESSSFSSSLSGTLKAGTGDALVFDTDATRLVTMKGSFGNDSFGAKITITGDDLIYSLMNHSHSQGGHTFANKTSSVASFSGDSVNTVRFLAAAFKGQQTATGGHLGGDFSHSFEGALEWQTDYYASIATGDSTLFSSTAALTDSFFSESREASVDFTGLSCDATPDYVVTMDFSDSNVLAIRTSCEGNREVNGRDNDYCWAGDVRTAQEEVQTACQDGC